MSRWHFLLSSAIMHYLGSSLTLSLFSFLRFKLRVLHLITAHISQISPRRFSGVVSATQHYHYHPYLLSTICISPTVVCIYLQPNLRRAAPTLCSLCISLCGRGCICCHVPRFIFPSRWELRWESSLRNWRSPPWSHLLINAIKILCSPSWLNKLWNFANKSRKERQTKLWEPQMIGK